MFHYNTQHANINKTLNHVIKNSFSTIPLSFISFAGSISNIDGDECSCSKTQHVGNKVISGVVGAASSVTSIQVANLLRLFRIPQVSKLS